MGAVNYCLKALIRKGFVKARNFSNSPKKMRYVYQLTPAGIAEKTALTRRFLQRKLVEYDALRAEIVELSEETGSTQATRAISIEDARVIGDVDPIASKP